MAIHPDMVIIGGGIIGLTSAYFLAKAGQSVEVLDRGDLGREASWAGAGIVPPGNPDRAATPIDKLRAIGSVKYPALSAELQERTGIDNGYLRRGGIEFLAPEDLDVLPAWTAEGIRHERLDADSLHRLEPHLEAIPGDSVPYHLPDCAQVRNPWHLRALIAACLSVGVRLSAHTPAIGWERSGVNVAGLRLASGELKRAERFLVAMGAWSEELLVPLGCRPAVRPVRGQIVLLNAGPLVITRVLMFGKRYMVPRGDGRILIGSTEEPEAGFEKANTEAAIRELVGFAVKHIPGLANRGVEKTWAGLRPGSPDGMPFIGPVPGITNVLIAAGHFRAGIQLSIGTAEMVRDLITGKSSAIPVEAFRLDRTPDLTVRPAFRS